MAYKLKTVLFTAIFSACAAAPAQAADSTVSEALQQAVTGFGFAEPLCNLKHQNQIDDFTTRSLNILRDLDLGQHPVLPEPLSALTDVPPSKPVGGQESCGQALEQAYQTLHRRAAENRRLADRAQRQAANLSLLADFKQFVSVYPLKPSRAE